MGTRTGGWCPGKGAEPRWVCRRLPFLNHEQDEEQAFP